MKQQQHFFPFRTGSFEQQTVHTSWIMLSRAAVAAAELNCATMANTLLLSQLSPLISTSLLQFRTQIQINWIELAGKWVVIDVGCCVVNTIVIFQVQHEIKLDDKYLFIALFSSPLHFWDLNTLGWAVKNWKKIQWQPANCTQTALDTTAAAVATMMAHREERK